MIYDARGNITSIIKNRGTYLSYTYDSAGRLTNGNATYRYSYDENGLRYKKEKVVNNTIITNTTRYYYDGTRVVAEEKDGELTRYYYDSSGVIGMFYNGSNYYFTKNLFGDIIKVVKSDGTVVAQYSYDTWGKCTVVTNVDGIANINPFRYRGYYYDVESDLYYLQSRYYSPEFRRFISLDSYSLLADLAQAGDLNLYAYCSNNPVMYTDPSGEFPVLACILGLTALVGMGLTIGGVAFDNSLMTAIGLTIVAIPALISGGMSVVAGIGGATLTGIIGGVTTIAGVGTGLFASAEYQEAFTGSNWMLNAGMSEGLYNGLMLATAAIAILGTFTSSFCYNFNIKSIDKIGKLIPSNHPNDGYWGIRFKNTRGSLRSIELQNHIPHWITFSAQLMEYNTYVCKNSKEEDMVFNNNVECNVIEEFENNCLEKISKSPTFMLLKKELIRKNLSFKMEIQRSGRDMNKYWSQLAIDIFNNKGERVCEFDEPNCCLMLCEPICYMRRGCIVGIDLLKDKEFHESLELLIEGVKKVGN